MKFLAFALFFCSALVSAQPIYSLGESNQGRFETERDSYVSYIDREKGIYIGLTVNFFPKGSTQMAAQSKYRLLKKNCTHKGETEIFEVEGDYDKYVSQGTVEIAKESLLSTIAYQICETDLEGERDPGKLKNTAQNSFKYVLKVPDEKWVDLGIFPLAKENMWIIPSSFQPEQDIGSVSLLVKIEKKIDKTTYFKVFMKNSDCEKQTGFMSMKNLETGKPSPLPFDFNPKSKNKVAVYFNPVTAILCKK